MVGRLVARQHVKCPNALNTGQGIHTRCTFGRVDQAISLLTSFLESNVPISTILTGNFVVFLG